MHITALIQNNRPTQGELRRAAAEVGVGLTTMPWTRLSSRIIDGRESFNLPDPTDVVLLWSMCSGSFEHIIFRMDGVGRLAASGMAMINSPRAIEIGVDKYLSLSLMRQAGLPGVDTVVCQSYDDAMQAFDTLGGDVVVKPIFGSQGFGITRMTDRALAQRAFTQLRDMRSIIYVQRYVPHDGSDVRLFVLGKRVLAAMRRRCGEGDWRTNVALGGRGEPLAADDALTDLALRAARACEAQVCGVDVLFDAGGRPYVLEVNPIPGWKELAAVCAVDVACELVSFVAARAEQPHATA